jgi:hypothetical protein
VTAVCTTATGGDLSADSFAARRLDHLSMIVPSAATRACLEGDVSFRCSRRSGSESLAPPALLGATSPLGLDISRANTSSRLVPTSHGRSRASSVDPSFPTTPWHSVARRSRAAFVASSPTRTPDGMRSSCGPRVTTCWNALRPPTKGRTHAVASVGASRRVGIASTRPEGARRQDISSRSLTVVVCDRSALNSSPSRGPDGSTRSLSRHLPRGFLSDSKSARPPRFQRPSSSDLVFPSAPTDVSQRPNFVKPYDTKSTQKFSTIFPQARAGRHTSINAKSPRRSAIFPVRKIGSLREKDAAG